MLITTDEAAIMWIPGDRTTVCSHVMISCLTEFLNKHTVIYPGPSCWSTAMFFCTALKLFKFN